MTRLLYFAWIREKIGKAEETFALPASVTTVAELVTWLRAKGPEYAEAFARPEIVRAAINQTHVKPSASIKDAREIAFFPPVSGG
jgi:molybdopterin synthase sulfur carrier subunit